MLRTGKKLLNSYDKLLNLQSHYRKMSELSEVYFEEFGDKGVITLNKPKTLNALNHSMAKSIYPKLKQWETEKSLVIIKGAGEKAFCAGGDVRSLTDAGKRGEDWPKEFFRDEYMLNYLIGTYKIPYIALISGITMGGGVGLSVHGSFRVATPRTVFAMPETALGFFTDVGGSYFLPRLSGEVGTFLGLTGHRLKGMDVLYAGVATSFCESDRVEELQKALIELKAPKHEQVSDLLNSFNPSDKSSSSLDPLMEGINKCFVASTVEGILEALAADGSEWATKQVAIMNRASPTSLKINLELLRRGSKLSFGECFAMEYRLARRYMDDHDFYEGVRSILVDKDNKPVWKPASIDQVGQDVIDRYFSALETEKELVL